jgi:hypothetical protein
MYPDFERGFRPLSLMEFADRLLNQPNELEAPGGLRVCASHGPT